MGDLYLSAVQDSLALGVIFAATDSVAVLQVLEPDREPLLFNLVFGEGVINDATAVALLRAVQVCSDCSHLSSPPYTTVTIDNGKCVGGTLLLDALRPETVMLCCATHGRN